ncbi:MAG: aminotransferase class I/II-fold pyridoxal phosphate-dependent enzyme [Kofleriaceae bacterium]
MSLDDDVRAELGELARAGRLRIPRVVDGVPGPTIVLDGIPVLNFASNDYLSLAGDRRLVRAASVALEEDGVGAGASRLITGNHRRHTALERSISDWMNSDGVRLFNTGYAANVGVLTTLLGPDDIVYSDALNHASIIDGCRLSRAKIVVFPHRDLAALEAALAKGGGRRRVVVSETLFSMDGDFADIEALSDLCQRYDAALIVDEAHALGTIGPEGRGVAAKAGRVPDVVIGTLGKAVGTFGAFAVTTRAIADLLWNRARSFVFSTGMPPSVAAASRAAIEIVRSAEGDDRRRILEQHAQRFRANVPSAGGMAGSPIAPIVVGDDRAVMQMSARLFERRVFVQGIRPPTVPVGSARLRVSLNASHAEHHIETICQSVIDAVRHVD